MKPGETWRGAGLKGSMLRTHGLRDFSRNTCSIDEAKAPEQVWDPVQTRLEGTAMMSSMGDTPPRSTSPTTERS